MKTKAFTLIELLVVIAIIAVLMAILMPSLNAARDQAKRVHCRSNVKTLSLAWFMYKDDNGDTLVNGNTGNSAWVTNPPNGATLQQQKDAIAAGMLFTYAGKDPDVYHCPADRRKQGMNVAFLTFSIPGGANGEPWSGYTRISKFSQIKHPSETYVFVEEADTRGTNVGSWQMDPTARTWVDPVAMWHKRQSTLGFADGHSEMHGWKDKSFIDWNLKAMYNTGFSFNMTPPADEQTDITYMVKGFPRR
jgi:prepilin-type N-terminal cleavage/methylation domain-containing protein